MKHFLILLSLLAAPAFANPVTIENATAKKSGGEWTFSATLRHPDTGWDHYADGWSVLDADGNELGFRLLVHPHVEEQPFTRSLAGVAVPAGLNKVYIRARGNVDGWSDPLFEITLPD